MVQQQQQTATTTSSKIRPRRENEEEETKKIRAERIEKISAKIHAVIWVMAAVTVFFLTDTINLINKSTKMNR